MKDNEMGPSPYIEDWSRETPKRFWDPGPKLLKSIRTYQRLRKSSTPWFFLARQLCVLRYRFWSVVSGAEIPLNTRIAGGLLITHPNGIVIHNEVEIGPNCLIFQQVTIGGPLKGGGVPRLGGNVMVGAGAKVLGNITIGDNVRIGANAVVVNSVQGGLTVAGVPAVPLESNTACQE